MVNALARDRRVFERCMVYALWPRLRPYPPTRGHKGDRDGWQSGGEVKAKPLGPPSQGDLVYLNACTREGIYIEMGI